MGSDFLKTVLAIDEDKESGIELLLRLCESLRLKNFNEKHIDQLEKTLLRIERTIQRIEESDNDSSLASIAQENLKLLGQSLLETSTDIFNKELPLKQLVNFFHAFDVVLSKSKKVTAESNIKFNLAFTNLIPNVTELASRVSSNIERIGDSKFRNTWLSHLQTLLKSSHEKRFDEISSEFDSMMTQMISHSSENIRYVKKLYSHVYTIDILKIKDVQLDQISLYVDDKRTRTISLNVPFQEYTSRYGDLVWEMDLTVKDDRNLSKVGFLLWSLGASLESIPGVETQITEFGEGSLWTRVKIFFKDLVAKEETKEVLDKTREALESQYFDKPIEEAKKIQSEKDKLNAETKLIEKQVDELDSEFTTLQKQYDIQSKVLDNRGKLLDIESKELDNSFRKIELIEKLSHIAANGIIQIDDLKIDINEVLFITKNSKELFPGEPMNSIEKGKKGLANEENDNDSPE